MHLTDLPNAQCLANCTAQIISISNTVCCQPVNMYQTVNSTRVIAVLCGIKIFAVRCLVLSQYTHLMDRQTDEWTDGQTEFRQQYRALHYMQSHGKNQNSLNIY